MATKKDAQELAQTKPADTGLSSTMTVDALLAQRSLITDAMEKVMKRDVDYGMIQGTEKNTLFQAGAQKLCMVFRLAPIFDSQQVFDGNHMTVKSNCVIKHSPTGMILGSGEGLCTTKEKKYAKRKEGGRIVENANLADLYNTVLKMANKRALVAAVLNVTAAGDIFTQDMAEEPLVVEDKDEPKPAEATVKEAPANGNGHHEDGRWVGTFKSVTDLTLPGGRDAWSIVCSDGLELKTTNKNFADAAKLFAGAGTVAEVKHHKNGNNSNVIDDLVRAKDPVHA
jgi:hypothetical protein